MAPAQSSTFWLTSCSLPWTLVRVGAGTKRSTRLLTRCRCPRRTAHTGRKPWPWPLRVHGSSRRAHASGHLGAREGQTEGFHSHPRGSHAVTWQWGCGGPQGCWGTAGRSPVGGCTQERLLTNGPCPHPAEPSCARRVSRPVCLADTRAPVGVSEQPSGSWYSPRSRGSYQ